MTTWRYLTLFPFFLKSIFNGHNFGKIAYIGVKINKVIAMVLNIQTPGFNP